MGNEAVQPVRVLFFSVLRERLGLDEHAVSIAAALTGSELLDLLEKRFPELSAYRPVVRLAVNQEYADSSGVVRPGDEVALITPVSGG